MTPVCNCHGCRFEKPELEAKVKELEQLLAIARQPFPPVVGCLHLRSYPQGSWRYCPDCGATYASISVRTDGVTNQPARFFDNNCSAGYE